MTVRNDRELHVRLSTEAFDAAQRQAAAKTGGNVSAYIRLLIASESVSTDPEVKIRLDGIRREINMIGININQLAKKGNGSWLTNSEVEQLFDQQSRVMEIFKKYIEELERDRS